MRIKKKQKKVKLREQLACIEVITNDKVFTPNQSFTAC